MTSAYSIKEFINVKSHKNLSGLFGANLRMGPFAAEHVPFGSYRIKVQSQLGSQIFGRLIDVCQEDESIEVPNHFARVHVVLLTTRTDVEDISANIVRVAKFRNADGTDMVSLFKGEMANEVPYGSYDLELFDPLTGMIKRRVDVFQPDVWVFSGLMAFGEYSSYLAPINEVQGKITNIPVNEEPVFVTLSGVYISHMINSVVFNAGGGSGTFDLIGVNPQGVYMLFTIGKSGILDARELNLPHDAEVFIDLSHPNPPKRDLP